MNFWSGKQTDVNYKSPLFATWADEQEKYKLYSTKNRNIKYKLYINMKHFNAFSI